jgi:hypothetical protein
VTVLTAMGVETKRGVSHEEQRAFNGVKYQAHRAFAASALTRHLVYDDVGHLFYTQRPDIVVDAMLEILDGLGDKAGTMDR